MKCYYAHAERKELFDSVNEIWVVSVCPICARRHKHVNVPLDRPVDKVGCSDKILRFSPVRSYCLTMDPEKHCEVHTH